MKLDETKLQEVVEKIAYQQLGQEQIDDLLAKMGILNEYVQEQLRLFAVVGQSEQFCSCSFVMIMRDSETDVAYCSECKREVNEQN